MRVTSWKMEQLNIGTSGSFVSNANGLELNTLNTSGGSSNINKCIVDELIIDDMNGNVYKLYSDTLGELKIENVVSSPSTVIDIRDKYMKANNVTFKHNNADSVSIQIVGDEISIV